MIITKTAVMTDVASIVTKLSFLLNIITYQLFLLIPDNSNYLSSGTRFLIPVLDL